MPGLTAHSVKTSTSTVGSTGTYVQCSGETKAAARCKKKVLCKDTPRGAKQTRKVYCHYHVGQEESLVLAMQGLQLSAKPGGGGKQKPAQKQKLQPILGYVQDPPGLKYDNPPVRIDAMTTDKTKPKRAYIYVYTLEAGHDNVHVFADGQFRPLGGESSWFKDLFRPSAGRKPRMTLIKVGYTTQTPRRRVDQWREQCRHPIRLLGPPEPRRWLFGGSGGGGYAREMEGWPVRVPERARAVERAVHERLWARYGRGRVHCEGCAKAALKPGGGGGAGGKMGTHTEWFLVPNDDKTLEHVYSVIADCIREG